MRQLDQHEIEAVNGGCSFITDAIKSILNKESGGFLSNIFGGGLLDSISNIFGGLFKKK
ncbi:Uncharacterised protein [Leminorella richardii]|uniref:Uncharacterized protein n=1 Tax=Leminorella richardii TaxID=158841 RepID=A0A2X4UVL2_9GAMM|nr:hypothetical protein [Leminorella richardii]SQI42933.1 Uncharacterised protein [Leminorella richardii]